MYYLSMDGGGTKLIALLFDDQYRLVSSARSDGTNLSIYPLEEACAHITRCYDRLFSGLSLPVHIETLYSLCGDSGLYERLLPQGVTLGKTEAISEPVSGLYAGSCRRSGFLALSGTGSDVFCIRDDRSTDIIGGWGAILGDEGSGLWMARLAIQSAIRYEHGWGEATCFGDLLKAHYGFTELREYVHYLYAAPAPFRRLGELLPLAAKAAGSGDPVMLDVFRQGGCAMGKQMVAMMHRHPDMPQHITACGGAWKAHPAMAKAFLATVKSEFPNAAFNLPQFEPVMAGPIWHAMKNGMEREQIHRLLSQNFSGFVWNHKGGTPQ